MADDCTCLYGGADEPNDFEVTAYRRARKAHRCRECNETIPAGTVYEHFSAKCDGALWTTKTCLCCAEIRKTFYCDGYYFGNLWQDVEEQMFEHVGLTAACLEKLVTPEAKQFLQRRWWAWVEEQTR